VRGPADAEENFMTRDRLTDVGSNPLISRVLDLARNQLLLDVACLARLDGDDLIVDAIAGDGSVFGIHDGWSCPGGAAAVAAFADGAVGGDHVFSPLAQVGAQVGAAVLLSDGQPYGVLCCAGRDDDPGLGRRDAGFLAMLAELVGQELDRQREEGERLSTTETRIRAALRPGSPAIVFQPIVNVRSGAVIGAEALARFPDANGPERWFADAASVGLGLDLELAAITAALGQLHRVPDSVYLSVNASPSAIQSSQLAALFDGIDANRIVIEITEHAHVDDYEALVDAVNRLRCRGARFAIDDAGAGYSSLRHVVRIQPDLIKLDTSLTRDIDGDAARRALARSLLLFADEIGATLIAEGVETPTELDALMALGVDNVQGYLTGRPGPLPLTPTLPDRALLPQRHLDSTSLARVVASATDIETLTRPLLESIVSLTGLEISYLTLFDAATNELDHRFIHNTSELELPPEGTRLAWSDTLCERCQTKGIAWTADVPRDLPGNVIAELYGIHTYLSLPVHSAEGRLLGTLCGASRERRYLPTWTVREIELLCVLVADRLARDRALEHSMAAP
jgi:EAL domain-containing protein (putative c-di-GMP-specific phosphodiesterase class I)/GAF domain-containing protein